MKTGLLFFCLVILFLLISCSPADQSGQIPASSPAGQEDSGTEPRPSTAGMVDQDILKEYPDSLDSALADLNMVDE